MLRYRLAHGLSLRQLAGRLGMQGHGGLSDYEKGRRLAPEDLIARYESQLRITDGELRSLHAAALAERASARTTDATAQPESLVIAELPAAPADFCGRDTELATIAAAAGECLAGRGPVTVVIAGQPGAGKTTFAVQAASRAIGLGLRDAQFFVELGEAAPEAVLHRLLRALGVPDSQLPADAAGGAAMFRSRLAGRRCVMVLDNARDEAQVRALLPGPGPALVLITSRDRLTGLTAARRVDLGELTEQDATGLLADIVGTERAQAEPEAMAEVVSACGRLPLAVRIAGNRLASWPNWSVAHLADLLRDEQRRLGWLTAGDLAVRGAFALSYRRVPATTRRLFRRLALAPGPDFGAEAAAVLLDEPAEEHLDALASASLLGLAATPGRYRLHDLLRLYAAELLVEEEHRHDREKAEHALFGWLFDNARANADAIAPLAENGPEARAAALTWLDTEAAALLEAARITAARADGVLDSLFRELTQRIPWYYDLRCRWPDMVEVASLAMVVAERSDDLRERAYAHSMLGLGRIGQHRYRSAVTELQAGMTDARAIGLAEEEAELCGRLGLAYEGLGRYAEAEASHAEHARQCQALGDRWGEAAAIGRRSHALRMRGEHSEAAVCLRRALAMRAELGDDRGVAMAEFRFSALRNDQGRYGEALRRADRALTVFEAQDDRWGSAVVRFELGRALAGLGRYAEAAASYRTAVTGLDQVGEWQRRAEAASALAEAQSNALRHNGGPPHG
ncbi:tetratricopeptide repeat protein [Kribbella sp. NBC_01245]|uniref:ATP-binding protein n=1 Tax=Kribbella sp. NBC_01245 TaxID=2903578 RepID=UPI002E291C17|nr:tetratricopeptide repeat protein [Kribbella sp. NBC_01245]